MLQWLSVFQESEKQGIKLQTCQKDPCGDDDFEARMEPRLLKQPLLSYSQELLTALKEEQGIERVGFALQGISRADLQASKQRDSKDPLLKDRMMHFKAGNHSEAFTCLNNALQIDPKNVEALVARGALFANNSNLRCALEDFEQALTLNPNYPNVRKYMSETLVALGCYYEERADLEGAVKMYKKAAKVTLSNTDAREALTAMEVKERKKKAELSVPQDTRSLSSQASLLAELQGEISKPTKDTLEKLRLLLKDEVEKKHKKRRRHRSSSSSSWSSTSSSSSDYKRHSRRHHRSKRSRKDRKESKAERHRGSKKKRKSRNGHRGNTSPPPEEVAPAASGSTAPGGTASECYWKDEPAVVLSSPPAEATKAAAHKKRHRHRSSSSSSWSSTSSSGRSSSSSDYKRRSRRHHRSKRSRKDRKESKAERHRDSKKKRKSRDGHRGNTSPPPEEVAPAATGSTAPRGTASECYWKDEPAVVLSSPPAEATKAAAQRSSPSPLSKKLAHLYKDEDEVEIMKGSRVDDHELSPKVTFLMKSNQKIQAPRLFNVDAKSAAASTAYYEHKNRSSESARTPSAEPAQSVPRIESAVKCTELQPAPERKEIKFKWKAVKKLLTYAGDSHEEGSVSSVKHREDAPQQQPSRGANKAAASSHEEGSIHSNSEPAKRKKDHSSSCESSPKDNEGHGKRKLRRRLRADSESYSSSGQSKSPVRRRRSSRRSADHSDDYSTDRSSVASRGRRRRSSRGGRSSDSSRDDSRRRRYSSEDSRDGRRSHSRSRSYSSDTDGSHRRHSPMQRGGYRPYYYNNWGGYYRGNFYNRRYNYRGGYQNTRYFRGRRGGRRPFRPYFNNRISPRSYYNSGGGSYQRSSYSRDQCFDSETPQDRSFCPSWKRCNPIVSRAHDAEEFKRLQEAAAQRAQEKQELAAAEGGASTSTQRINKATIIRNWLDDGDSWSPLRANSPPSRKKNNAPPLPPLPTDAPPLPTDAPPLPTDAPPLPESD